MPNSVWDWQALLPQGLAKTGDTMGNKVWSNGGWQDKGNAQDQAQQLQWSGDKQSQYQSKMDRLGADLIDPNSQMNQSLFGLYMRMAARSMPGGDVYYGSNKGRGMNSGDAQTMGNLQARQDSLQATDKATTGFGGAMIDQRKLGLQAYGSEGSSIAANQQAHASQYETDMKEKASKRDFWGGLASSGIGLIGGGLTYDGWLTNILDG